MASTSVKSSIAYDRMGPLRAKPASLPAPGMFFGSSYPSDLSMTSTMMNSSTLDMSSSKNAMASGGDLHVQTAVSPIFFSASGPPSRPSSTVHHTTSVRSTGLSGSMMENSEEMDRKVTVEQVERNLKKSANITCSSDETHAIGSSVPVTPARLPHDSLLGLKRNHPEFLFGHYEGVLSYPRSFILQKGIGELVSVFGDDFTSWFTVEKQNRLGVRVISSVENSVSGSNDVTFYQNWPQNSTLLAPQNDQQNMTTSYNGIAMPMNGDNGDISLKNHSSRFAPMNHPSAMGESFIDALDQDESVFFPAPNESFRPSGKSASSTPNQRPGQAVSFERSVIRTGDFSLNGSALDAMRTLEMVAAAAVGPSNNDQSATVPHSSPQDQCDESHESAINKLLNLSDELNANLTVAVQENSGVHQSDEVEKRSDEGQIVHREEIRSSDRSFQNGDSHSLAQKTKTPEGSFLFQLPLQIESSNQVTSQYEASAQSPIYHFTGKTSDDKWPLREHQPRNRVPTGSDDKSMNNSAVADQLEVSFKKRRISLPVNRQDSCGSTTSSGSTGVQSLPGCTSSAKKRSLHGDSINQSWSQGLQTIVMKSSAEDVQKPSPSLKFFPENIHAENFVPKSIKAQPVSAPASTVPSSMIMPKHVTSAASFTPVSLMECLTGGCPVSSSNKSIMARPLLNTLTTQSQKEAVVDQYIPRPDNPMHLSTYHMRRSRFLDLIGRARMSPNQALHHLGPMLYHVSPKNGSPVVPGQTIPLRTMMAPPTMIIDSSFGLQRVVY